MNPLQNRLWEIAAAVKLVQSAKPPSKQIYDDIYAKIMSLLLDLQQQPQDEFKTPAKPAKRMRLDESETPSKDDLKRIPESDLMRLDPSLVQYIARSMKRTFQHSQEDADKMEQKYTSGTICLQPCHMESLTGPERLRTDFRKAGFAEPTIDMLLNYRTVLRGKKDQSIFSDPTPLKGVQPHL